MDESSGGMGVVEHALDVVDGTNNLLGIMNTLVDVVQERAESEEADSSIVSSLTEHTSDVVDGTNNLLGIMDTLVNIAQELTNVEEGGGGLVVVEHTLDVVDGTEDLLSIMDTFIDVVQDLSGVDLAQDVTEVKEFNTNGSRTSTDDGTDLLGSLDDLKSILSSVGNIVDDLSDVEMEEFVVVVLEHTSDVIDSFINLLGILDTLVELAQDGTEMDESSGKMLFVVLLEHASDVVDGTSDLLDIIDTLINVV